MKQASQGIELKKLIAEIDTKLEYGVARKASEFEAELLDQIDESLDNQIKLQNDLKYAEKEKRNTQEILKATDNAINKFCSETTRDKINLSRGWQFPAEKAKKIVESPSDRELVGKMRNEDKKVHEGLPEITMEKVVKKAINEGTTAQDVARVEAIEKGPKKQNQREVKAIK